MAPQSWNHPLVYATIFDHFQDYNAIQKSSTVEF